MPTRPAVVLEPRKSPVQARSAASVDAILDGTIQVLLSVGKERLTTTRVALRAGVSVGTLYQYFPNKSALLQAALKRHINEVQEAIHRVCREDRGRTLRHMGTALINAYLGAKMRDANISVALYAVSSDIDGQKIAQASAARAHKAIVALLGSASDPLAIDPQLAASMVQGAMAGVSRRLLESDAPKKHLPALQTELIFFVCTYLEASAARNPKPEPTLPHPQPRTPERLLKQQDKRARPSQSTHPAMPRSLRAAMG